MSREPHQPGEPHFDPSVVLEPSDGYVLGRDGSLAFWHVGTYWRLLSSTNGSDGRSVTFDELCPTGVVAPPHVHDNEEEAFFVLEGDLVFTLGQDEVEAPPGTYIYIPPGIRHGFRCRSAVGRVYNTLTPGGFDHGLLTDGTPATIVELPPPEVSALDVWKSLDAERIRAPWDGLTEWPETHM
jgi:quercetin dioxygenase-like cupin family protein